MNSVGWRHYVADAATPERHRTQELRGTRTLYHLGFQLLASGMRGTDYSFRSHSTPSPSSWSPVTAATWVSIHTGFMFDSVTAAMCTMLLTHSGGSVHVSGISDSSRPGTQGSLQRCGCLWFSFR